MIIITCCTKKDILTFESGIVNIEKYLKFSLIILCVPDEDYSLFVKKFENKINIKIKKDSEIIDEKKTNLILSKLKKNNNQKMYGWYLQQFIKITESAKYKEDVPILIWDSDTIPLRPLQFINSDKTLNFYVSNEYHEPYFNTIKKALQYEKIIPQSFIAQCIPLYSRHSQKLIEKLGGNEKWIHKIMDSLDLSSNCSFSEYETLGTFIAHNEPKVINLCVAPWKRDGYRDVFIKGSITEAIKVNSFEYAYVAIEKADRSKLEYLIKKISDKFNLF